MTTLCTDFEQNRLTFISKSAPVSQAEALKVKSMKTAEMFFEDYEAPNKSAI